jgi:D-serine dehydratase
MLLGWMTGLYDGVSVRDFGLDGVTDADGLAVARPSAFVGKAVEQMVSGVYTVRDQTLYTLLHMLVDTEQIALEPSALAGMPGPFKLFDRAAGKQYLEKQALWEHMPNATHIVWATGGGMVPPDVMQAYYEKGAAGAPG